MNDSIITALTQFGGLGVLAGFAYILLKGFLKQQERLAKLIDNHLTKLLERQEIMNQLLVGIVKKMDEPKG